MATGDGYGDGESGRSKRRRGAGDCTCDDDIESGRNKRCQVAAGSTGHDSESGNSIDRGSDAYGGHAEEADNDGYYTGDGLYDDTDDDEGGYDEAPKAVATSEPAPAGKRYIVLTEDDVRERQEGDTAKVAEVLSIPSGFAAVLLRHFKWRVVRVLEEWFSDDRRVREAVGLRAYGVPVPMAVNPRQLDCAICFGRFSAGGMRSAGCAHYYCDDCWRGYIHAAVGDGARCLALRCPDLSCSAAVVRELIDEAAEDADKTLYAQFTLRSYVEESGGRFKWCPGPDCSLAAEFLGCASEDDATDVLCECKHCFCWSCGEESHRPVSCDTVRAWLAKNNSDSATASWVLANTKRCPKCRRPIEKNQGCMRMTCSFPCGHQFCWLCLDPWNHHTGCDGFRIQQDELGKKLALTLEEERRRQAKASLDRYLYHYERWSANQTSRRKVFKDLAELESSELEKMAATVDLPVGNFDFLTKAYRQIADGRRVLQWAYAYGYYLDPERDAAKRALFEDLQDQANSWLERLHGCAELERKEIFCAQGKAAVVSELLRYYKKKVIDLTAATRTFLGNLVKAFEIDLPEFKSLN
ncbi:probable E3 ubiquitin-protein ligase ARI5 [Phragmites australis]|uniref:probable E3 ubiquitin-protein ligase ARI5 n=1 Tax=Phragmites australis TaxID=29695 RepID=UPI002D7701BD|nr:probable E3 ubiquitin-protein ligase ARI5 [Phragmites australis]